MIILKRLLHQEIRKDFPMLQLYHVSLYNRCKRGMTVITSLSCSLSLNNFVFKSFFLIYQIIKGREILCEKLFFASHHDSAKICQHSKGGRTEGPFSSHIDNN